MKIGGVLEAILGRGYRLRLFARGHVPAVAVSRVAEVWQIGRRGKEEKDKGEMDGLGYIMWCTGLEQLSIA